MSFRLRVLESMAEVPRAAWDALLGSNPNPFLLWSWLNALEAEGCVTPEIGWSPCHLSLWDGDRLIAAAPAYLKDDSDGDFSRDWEWAARLERSGVPWYPKLVLTVPFTPAAGPRLLVHPEVDADTARAALLEGARALAREVGCGVIEVLYVDEGELESLARAGFARRPVIQYHWRNPGYRSFDDFLGRFSAKKRTMIRRERAAPSKQGIALRTVSGNELASEPRRWAEIFHTMQATTVDRMAWGRRWLTESFYARVFRELPEALELVVAEREGKPIAGAFNLLSASHLYGRYWGAVEDHPFLHFNVCLYHSIEECIRRGVSVFEGGAGGEHKLARGFEPVAVWSAWAFGDRRVEEAMGTLLAQESELRQRAIERWYAEEAVLKPFQADREAVG